MISTWAAESWNSPTTYGGGGSGWVGLTASDIQRRIDYVNREYEYRMRKEMERRMYSYDDRMQYWAYDNYMPCTQPTKPTKTESKKPYKEESLRKLFWYRFLQTGELPFKKTFS